MARVILTLLFLVFIFGHIVDGKASSEIPYWAGLKSEKKDGSDTYSIQFSEDGSKFTFIVLSGERRYNGFGRGECSGSVKKTGVLFSLVKFFFFFESLLVRWWWYSHIVRLDVEDDFRFHHVVSALRPETFEHEVNDLVPCVFHQMKTGPDPDDRVVEVRTVVNGAVGAVKIHSVLENVRFFQKFSLQGKDFVQHDVYQPF